MMNRMAQGTEERRFSVVIPVFNEAEEINALLFQLRVLEAPGKLEIIVVDGSPEGDTMAAITDESVLKFSSEKGRGHQLNTGAAGARGEMLVFLHADTRLPAGSFELIKQSLEEPGISAGAFSLGVDSRKASLRFIARMTTLRSRLTRIPYGDQTIFIKRELFEEMGGFPDIPIMEDLEFMRRLRKKGHRIRILEERVLSSTRRWEQEGVLLCTLRNWFIKGLFLLGMPAGKLKRFYR